jgi:hypothetical protein
MKLFLSLNLCVLFGAISSVGCYGQGNSITAKFYFPGQVGISFPFGNPNLNLNKGFMLTTAFEFRPAENNSVFYRFNYDAVSNHYQQVYSNSPTNVNAGKLSSTIFSLGVGYRHRDGLLGLFGLIQPGIATNNYDKVNFDQQNISINQVSRRHASLKLSAGVEYYLAEHFALTFEPSYFYLSPCTVTNY